MAIKHVTDKMRHQSSGITSIMLNVNKFHSLEVVDSVTETQLHMGENFNLIIWRLKG